MCAKGARESTARGRRGRGPEPDRPHVHEVQGVRRRGRVAFVGEAAELTLHVSNDLIRQALTLFGQWHYPRSALPRMLRVVAGSTARLDKMITHAFPMSRVRDAFELQITRDCGKVLLWPRE
jgi:threonine dehydrogenase-like Zn-dependent dehydrogenase